MTDDTIPEPKPSARQLAELAKRPGELPTTAIRRLGAAAGFLMAHAGPEQRDAIRSMMIEQVNFVCGDG